MCPTDKNVKLPSEDAAPAAAPIEGVKASNGRQRSESFHNLNSKQATDYLTDFVREKGIFLGGSSVGKGLKKAARYFLEQRQSNAVEPEYLKLRGAVDLNPDLGLNPQLEDPFYVVDIGVVMSQVYQWRKYFPRVQPFYAVKCEPDPVVIRVLAILGASFDCASRAEFRLVQSLTKDLPRKPDIIFANPCKPPAHIMEAVCSGIRMMTFDNVVEVQKCAAISKSIELVMRIMTDDRGSQCRLSSKFGAPRIKWRPLLAAAKKNGLKVVGVSFHVGSGCRDASKYELALKDAREIFDMAKSEFGFDMKLIDIGGGFPGETHSMWNPATEIDEERPKDDDEDEEDDDQDEDEDQDQEDDDESGERFMFFTEIAEQVAPVIDRLFPPESGVRIIGEPGRYMVAACATLCCSVVSTRSNELDTKFDPEPISDREAAENLHDMSREEESNLVRKRTRSRGESLAQIQTDEILENIIDGLQDYSKLYARQNLAQQEADVYNDSIDLFNEGFETAVDLLGPPSEAQMEKQTHTVEGMNYPLVISEKGEEQQPSALITLAAAGEAAVNGVVMQAVADSAPLSDDFAIYINDGVYGGFNGIIFDHQAIRPRVLHGAGKVVAKKYQGIKMLQSQESSDLENGKDKELFASTIFGPTCDSIDVIARSVLLPRLNVGDWLYFQNTGAYSSAAASSFNGFSPSEKMYVCSIKPEYWSQLLDGPTAEA